MRLALTPETGNESQEGQTASLFEEPSLSPHEKIYKVLKADEALHLDEIIEKLEAELSSSKMSPRSSNWSWLERSSGCRGKIL